MTRLITFGDSLTFGHWLDPTDTYPSDRAWPKVLGDMLGYRVVNTAVPGHSNIQILKDILNFEFQQTDIVIVGWTYPQRDYIFRKNLLGMDTSIQVNVWHKDTKFIEKWAAVHNNYDLSVRTGLHIHHAECFLKTKNVQQHHFSTSWAWYEVMPNFILTPTTYINEDILTMVDKALDNSHPGHVSHSNAAKKLYGIINAPK